MTAAVAVKMKEICNKKFYSHAKLMGPAIIMLRTNIIRISSQSEAGMASDSKVAVGVFFAFSMLT